MAAPFVKRLLAKSGVEICLRVLDTFRLRNLLRLYGYRHRLDLHHRGLLFAQLYTS